MLKKERIGVYCSKKCRHLGTTTKVTKRCPQCGKDFIIHLSNLKQSPTSEPCCSRKCGMDYRWANKLMSRFLGHILVLPGPNSCWVWTGTTCHGYGVIRINGKVGQVSKFSYEYFRRPLEKGELIRHKVCDNPSCMNPAHLMSGSHADNKADCVEKGRQYSILKEADVRFILDHPEIPTREVAKQYNVALTTIYSIRGGYNWKRISRTASSLQNP